jgi:hypothetical protein
MKVRLGITAPLVLTTADTGYLRWPSFAERNFTIGEQFQHSLWVESSQPLESTGGKLKAEQGKPGVYALRGQLHDEDLWLPANSVRASRPAGITYAWTKNTREADGQLIRQAIVEKPPATPDRVVVVIDGTKGMEACYPAIEAALRQLPAGTDFAMLLAKDGCEELIPLQKTSTNLVSKAVRQKLHSAGGQDNVPALNRAWDLAAQAKGGVIVWVHGPQPILLDEAEELRQRFERSPDSPALIEVQTQPGPNRVLEKLDGIKAVRSMARVGTLGDDLGRLFSTWRDHTGMLELVREKVQPGQSQGAETSMHLARLWAADEVSRLCAARHFTNATQLATRYQLVTPVSGAVVLETQAQYARAGLEPVPPESVPTIPEPSAAALLLLGLIMITARRRLFQRSTWRV